MCPDSALWQQLSYCYKKNFAGLGHSPSQSVTLTSSLPQCPVDLSIRLLSDKLSTCLSKPDMTTYTQDVQNQMKSDIVVTLHREWIPQTDKHTSVGKVGYQEMATKTPSSRDHSNIRFLNAFCFPSLCSSPVVSQQYVEKLPQRCSGLHSPHSLCALTRAQLRLISCQRMETTGAADQSVSPNHAMRYLSPYPNIQGNCSPVTSHEIICWIALQIRSTGLPCANHWFISWIKTTN